MTQDKKYNGHKQHKLFNVLTRYKGESQNNLGDYQIKWQFMNLVSTNDQTDKKKCDICHQIWYEFL